MKKLLFIALLLPFLSGCSDDKDETTPTNSIPSNTKKCFATEINQDNNDYTQQFTYDPSDKITKVVEIDGSFTSYHTVEYDNNRVKKNNYFRSDNTASGQDVFEYNAAGQLTKEDFYSITNNIPSLECSTSYEYGANGKVSKKSSICRGAAQGYTTYAFVNNTLEKRAYTTSGAFTGSVEFVFDDKKNPLSETALISDYDFYVTNNITKYTEKDKTGAVDQESYSATYQYNSDGYPVSSQVNKLSGSTRNIIYTYNCK